MQPTNWEQSILKNVEFFQRKKARRNNTKNLAETIRYMIENFTPEDSEEFDNDRHKLFRVEITEPITTEDGTPFTTLHTREAIKGNLR
jgi:hypothetical protein